MNDGTRTLTEIDINQVTPQKVAQFGALGVTADGRAFRYVGFGGTSTVNPGTLLVAGPLSANSTGLALSSSNTTANLSAGSNSLRVVNGATAVTQDQFAEGFADVVGAGANVSYRIVGNTAAAAGGTITLTLADTLSNVSALVVGTNTVNLTASPFAGVVASTTLSRPVGVSRVVVPNTAGVSNYGWVQVTGHCLVTATAAVAKGAAVSQDTGTAGNVLTTSGAAVDQIGVAKEAIGAAGVGPVSLAIG